MKIKKIGYDSESINSDSSTSSNSDYTYETITEQEGGKKWMTFGESAYRRPKKTKQDQLTKDEILKKLTGYIRLKYSDQLEELKPFKTWVKYINKDSKKFRQGGLYVKSGFTKSSQTVPTYIVLYNPRINIVWSVQLKNNWLYIPDTSGKEEQQKEEAIKDKLYELYLDGRLKVQKPNIDRPRNHTFTDGGDKQASSSSRPRHYTEPKFKIYLDRSEN